MGGREASYRRGRRISCLAATFLRDSCSRGCWRAIDGGRCWNIGGRRDVPVESRGLSFSKGSNAAFKRAVPSYVPRQTSAAAAVHSWKRSWSTRHTPALERL